MLSAWESHKDVSPICWMMNERMKWCMNEKMNQSDPYQCLFPPIIHTALAFSNINKLALQCKSLSSTLLQLFSSFHARPVFPPQRPLQGPSTPPPNAGGPPKLTSGVPATSSQPRHVQSWCQLGDDATHCKLVRLFASISAALFACAAVIWNRRDKTYKTIHFIAQVHRQNKQNFSDNEAASNVAYWCKISKIQLVQLCIILNCTTHNSRAWHWRGWLHEWCWAPCESCKTAIATLSFSMLVGHRE